MTWTKFGSEFFPECLHHGLPDAAVRTHCEAIAYLYEVEESSCRIEKRLVRTFAGSEDFHAGIEALVAVEWWTDQGGSWEVVHHADVIRQSLAAQQKQRAISKKTSAKYRQKKAEEKAPDDTPGTTKVTRHVTPDADRQTDKHLGTSVPTTCAHGTDVRFWKCSDCDEKRETA